MDTKNKFSKKELKMPEKSFGAAADKTQPSFLGIIIGLLILVLIALLGGLYLWGEQLQKVQAPLELPQNRPTADQNNEPESNNAEADVETLGTMSNSDEVGTIAADLESTNLETLTDELIAVDEIIQR